MRFAVRTEQRCPLIEVRQFQNKPKTKRIWTDIKAAVNARVRDVKRTVEVIQGIFSVSKNTLPPNRTSIFNSNMRAILKLITHVIIAGLTTVLRHQPIRRWFYARAASDVRNAQTGATGVKWTPDLTSDVGAKSRAYGFYATGPWRPDDSCDHVETPLITRIGTIEAIIWKPGIMLVLQCAILAAYLMSASQISLDPVSYAASAPMQGVHDALRAVGI